MNDCHDGLILFCPQVYPQLIQLQSYNICRYDKTSTNFQLIIFLTNIPFFARIPIVQRLLAWVALMQHHTKVFGNEFECDLLVSTFLSSSNLEYCTHKTTNSGCCSVVFPISFNFNHPRSDPPSLRSIKCSALPK